MRWRCGADTGEAGGIGGPGGGGDLPGRPHRRPAGHRAAGGAHPHPQGDCPRWGHPPTHPPTHRKWASVLQRGAVTGSPGRAAPFAMTFSRVESSQGCEPQSGSGKPAVFVEPFKAPEAPGLGYPTERRTRPVVLPPALRLPPGARSHVPHPTEVPPLRPFLPAPAPPPPAGSASAASACRWAAAAPRQSHPLQLPLRGPCRSIHCSDAPPAPEAMMFGYLEQFNGH